MKRILLILMLLAVDFAYASSPKYYGVVVGCCDNFPYSNIKGLHAKDDAEIFYNDLLNIYYKDRADAEDKVYLLTNENATKDNIKSALKKVTKKAQKGDFLYFFFSGHGSSLSDKSVEIASEYKKNNLMEIMENSGLILPYDFNIKKTAKSAIIGKRDLKINGGYGFKNLDDKGVQVIMISDSCYSGNIFRSASDNTNKFIPRNRLSGLFDELDSFNDIKTNKPEDKDYKKLLFFSAGGTDKAVTEDNKLGRGKFSLIVQKCMKISDLNRDKDITKSEFRECLRNEDSANSFVLYPADKKNHSSVVFNNIKNIKVSNRGEVRIKSKIDFSYISNYIIIDNNIYDVEIIKKNKKYTILKYTGEEYAIVDKDHLKKYLNAYRIFKLKGKKLLDITIKSLDSGKEESVYCDGEDIVARIDKKNNPKYIVALTLNRKGQIIILQPNNSSKSSLNFIETVVEEPFGMDKLKIFSLDNKKQFNNIRQLTIKDGYLDDFGVEKLFNILSSDKNFKDKEIDIQTIKKHVSKCRLGDK